MKSEAEIDAERQECATRTINQWLGPRYAECRLFTFRCEDPQAARKREVLTQLEKIRDDLRCFVKRGTNLVFFGPAGTGKDHLAASLLWQAVYLGAQVASYSGPQLWSQTRDLIDGGGSEKQFLDKFRDPHVVLISDPTPPGKSLTDAQADWLYRIVDRRYRDMKPTWLTANVADRKDAEAKLTVQVWDRLRDGAVTVDCNWPSYRKPDRQI